MAKSRKLLVYCVIALLAWATPAIAEVVYTTFANIFTANQRVNAGVGINIAPGATGTLSLSSGIFERSRSTMMGEWTAVSYNAGDFTAGGTMTWTVESADVANYSYMLVGKTLFVAVNVGTTTTGGTADFKLQVAIPGGFTCTKATTTASLYVVQSGIASTGVFDIAAGATIIKIYKSVAAPNWGLTTNDIYVQGIIAFQVN